MKDLKKKVRLILFLVLGLLIISIPFLFPGFLMPGELTANHNTLPCDDCHKPWQGPQDSKCLTCHENQDIHWHNDSAFQSNCQSCHKLHGKEINKTDLDCNSCHTQSHAVQNFSEYDCSECHEEPDTILLAYTHQNQDVEKISEKDKHTKGDDCYLCHDTNKFNEYNCLTEDCHGTDKYDEKHEEKAMEWKTTDCFEPGCHSKKAPKDPVNNTGATNPEIADENGQNVICLVFIIILAVVILILGYIYIRRAMEQ